MHDIQKVLLKRLLTINGQKYSTLTRGYNYEDNVVFHLKQLISNGYIEKSDGIYTLTANGTKEITKYDLGLLEDTGFKTFFIGFVCKCGSEYLLKEHSGGKNNFYNLPSGKPRFGENTNDALVRTFFENTGLKLKTDDFKYVSLHLKTVKTSTGEILFDDAFAVYEVVIDETIKKSAKLSKQIGWHNIDEIKKLDNLWPEVKILIVEGNTEAYLSYEFTSDYIL